MGEPCRVIGALASVARGGQPIPKWPKRLPIGLSGGRRMRRVNRSPSERSALERPPRQRGRVGLDDVYSTTPVSFHVFARIRFDIGMGGGHVGHSSH
jgi:hypothetical protein